MHRRDHGCQAKSIEHRKVPPRPGGPDRRRRARAAWLERPTTLRKDHATPRQLGYWDDGDECKVRLVSRAIRCDERTVRDTFSDDPFLAEAQQAGFMTLVCEAVSSGNARTEYGIGDVLGKR